MLVRVREEKTSNSRPTLQGERSQVAAHDFQQAIREIERLEGVIKEYKRVLMAMKRRCVEMEEREKEKVFDDHLVDVLKSRIEELQDNNHSLNQKIAEQKQVIDNFQFVFMDKVKQINDYYSSKLGDTIKLGQENQALREVLIVGLAPPSPPKVASNESS